MRSQSLTIACDHNRWRLRSLSLYRSAHASCFLHTYSAHFHNHSAQSFPQPLWMLSCWKSTLSIFLMCLLQALALSMLLMRKMRPTRMVHKLYEIVSQWHTLEQAGTLRLRIECEERDIDSIGAARIKCESRCEAQALSN